MQVRKIVKALYAAVPFKQPLFSVLRRLPVPTALMRHLRFKGVITVRIDAQHAFRMHNRATFIENDLFWKGFGKGFEATSLKVWSRLAGSKVIVDVGANTGVYALVAKTLNPDAIVIAFEPSPKIHPALLENIHLNGLDIRAEKLAVSDSTGVARMYDDASKPNSLIASLDRDSLLIHETPVDDDRVASWEVDCVRLDDYVEGRALGSVDLIKIDVEGHEIPALRGLGSIIARDKPAILIEILTQEAADGATALIDGLGYEIHQITEGTGLTKVDRLAAPEGPHRNYLLCQPETRIAFGLDQAL